MQYAGNRIVEAIGIQSLTTIPHIEYRLLNSTSEEIGSII